MKRFEYKQENTKLSDSYLNSLGEDGWEMINCSVSDSQWRQAYYFYMFKRELINN